MEPIRKRLRCKTPAAQVACVPQAPPDPIEAVSVYPTESRKRLRCKTSAAQVAYVPQAPPDPIEAVPVYPPECDSWLEVLKPMLRGQDLTAVTLGATRKWLAERLQLGRKGLEHRKDEVKEVVTRAILEVGSEPESAKVVPLWATPADEYERLMIFLVTLSSTLDDSEEGDAAHSTPLRDPSDLSRLETQDAVLDSLWNPVTPPGNQGGRPRAAGQIAPLILITAEEPHESRPGKTHKHVVVKLSAQASFMPYKLALREKHGLASHWSLHHTAKIVQVWSIVV